jgi:hypothetical protein
MDPKDKRLIAEVATTTIKAGISIDKTALKAHEDDSQLKQILQRLRESEGRLRREEIERSAEVHVNGLPSIEIRDLADASEQ